MSWTSVGFAVVPKTNANIVEKQYGNSIYINLNVIDKHHYNPEKREWLKLSIQVPTDEIEQARQAIQPGRAFLIRFAELGGNKLESGYVAMSLQTKWRYVEPVKAMPQAGIKKNANNY
jgi:hypothetical protein